MNEVNEMDEPVVKEAILNMQFTNLRARALTLDDWVEFGLRKRQMKDLKLRCDNNGRIVYMDGDEPQR